MSQQSQCSKVLLCVNVKYVKSGLGVTLTDIDAVG